MTKPKADPSKAGRHSAYSEEIADQICELMIHGKSLYDICKIEGMPSYVTIWRWTEKYPEFESKCARARALQAEFMDHKIMETAENCDAKDAYAAKVKIAAYQWRAMKLAPKRYGEQSNVHLHHHADVTAEPAEVTDQKKDSWLDQHGNGKGPTLQ